jgi:hypothetical protein
MILDDEIEATLARLMGADADPKGILMAFAEKVREGVPTIERVVEQKVCAGCGDEDALCFSCKIQGVVGEQALLAAPLILPKVMAMAKEAFQEAMIKRAARKASEEPERPNPGPQRF